MKTFKWKWIFTRSKTCCTIWRPFQFAMAAILNPKWPPKYKNPPIWAKFVSKQRLFLRIDNCHRFWNWEPYYDPSDHIISCYYSSSSFFLSSVKSLSDTFLGYAQIKLYETLQEYHMPCEVVPLMVDFFKMAAIAMETAKMLKK